MTELDKQKTEDLTKASLEQLESRIQKGIETWVEVSLCLRQIKDRKLYNQKGFDNFDDYCRGVWGWSKNHVYRQIGSGKTMEIIAMNSSRDEKLPEHETHARELTPLARVVDEQEVVQTWRELKEEHGDKLTKIIIRDAVQEKLKTLHPIPQPKPKPETPTFWTESEKERRLQVEDGEAVTANIYKDVALVEWARKEGFFVRIDRATAWGNPFEIPGDGDRDEVCESYKIYFGLKKSLHGRIGELKGKVLGCHCYPERCHGDFLKEVAENEI